MLLMQLTLPWHCRVSRFEDKKLVGRLLAEVVPGLTWIKEYLLRLQQV